MASARNPIDPIAARSASNGLGRLAAWCYDHRRRVLLGWVLAVVTVVGLAGRRPDGRPVPARTETARAQLFRRQ